MKRTAPLILFLLLLFCSCSDPTLPAPAAAQAFGSHRVFDREAVLRYTADFPEEPEAAGQLFLEAIHQYRNEKDLRKAKKLFLQSLAYYPTSRAYYELGNVCMDREQYEEAISAYGLAETLGYRHQSKLLYHMACAYSQLHKPDTARRYLEFAIEAGYSNRKQIASDPDLVPVRTSNEHLFEKVYADALSGSSDPGIMLWQMFRREFHAATFPLVLNEQTHALFKNAPSISYDFERFIAEMRNVRFSREVDKEFYPIAQVESNDRYTALVYAAVESVMGDDAPTGYLLVSFDGRGNLIDKMHVGGQTEFGGLSKAATIQSNLHFEVRTFKAIYEKDPEQEGYDNNRIVDHELIADKYYRILENGTFEEQQPALSVR